MSIEEIIRRLEKIAEHAVHTPGETSFVMGLDDGIALHEAVELLRTRQELVRLLRTLYLISKNSEEHKVVIDEDTLKIILGTLK